MTDVDSEPSLQAFPIERVLVAVLESLDVAVIGCDPAGKPILFNNAARLLFGGLLDGVPVGQWPAHMRMSLPGDPTATDSPLVRALSGEEVRDGRIVLHADGQPPRIFRVHGGPVSDSREMLAVAALHDITEQQRAAQLKECELAVSLLLARPEPADTLVSQAVELIGTTLQWRVTEFWTLDHVGQVLRRGQTWHAAGQTMPGELPETARSGAGLPGRAWRDSVPVWSPDVRQDGIDGGTDWGTLRSALAVPIPSGEVTLGVLVCYSDADETQDDGRTAVLAGIAAHLGEFLERRRAEQFAAELERIRDEYIALVGHELRTPLTTIQAYAEMMLEDVDLPAPDRLMMLQVMQRKTGDLHAITAKLLDVAGVRSGHIHAQRRRLDLTALMRDAVQAARAQDPVAEIDLNVQENVVISADQDQIRRVVDELMGNAMTWAPPGSTIGVAVHADEHTAVIAISNTGTRIPADEREQVFDQFFRTGAAQHSAIPGAGLGLTLARAVIELHHGSIVVSEPQEATTTFTVRLPASHA